MAVLWYRKILARGLIYSWGAACHCHKKRLEGVGLLDLQMPAPTTRDVKTTSPASPATVIYFPRGRIETAPILPSRFGDEERDAEMVTPKQLSFLAQRVLPLACSWPSQHGL